LLFLGSFLSYVLKMTTTRASLKCSISLIHLNTDEVFHNESFMVSDELLRSWVLRHGLSTFPDGTYIPDTVRDLIAKKNHMLNILDSDAVLQNQTISKDIVELQRTFLYEEFTKILMSETLFLQPVNLTYFKVLLSFMLKSHAKMALDCIVMAMTFCEEHLGLEPYYMLFMKLFEQIMFQPKPYRDLVLFLNEYKGQTRVQHAITRIFQIQ